jgi:hypothetical protein
MATLSFDDIRVIDLLETEARRERANGQYWTADAAEAARRGVLEHGRGADALVVFRSLGDQLHVQTRRQVGGRDMVPITTDRARGW